LLDRREQGLYMGEAVTELEHALQAAQRATAAGAPETAVIAALLPDVGPPLSQQAGGAAERGSDARPEAPGSPYPSPCFAPEIVDPVRLHVAAKRYLCAVEPAYQAGLSPASRRSLGLQGGPMRAAEVSAFEQEPHFQVAVTCRRWDDAAKVPGLRVPGLETY